MRPVVLKCPSCEANLTVNRLRCSRCEINIDGDFAMPALLRLTPAQIDFAEVFIKNRGVIRDVERELGISYPTVRARLDDVVQALGYSARNASNRDVPASASARRRAILADLKAGKLSPEQALAALNENAADED